jgi:hypothetical protein
MVLDLELERIRDVGCESIDTRVALEADLSSGCCRPLSVVVIAGMVVAMPITEPMVALGSGRSSLGAESSVSVSDGVRVTCGDNSSTIVVIILLYQQRASCDSIQPQPLVLIFFGNHISAIP